jgi:hypothetical protein
MQCCLPHQVRCVAQAMHTDLDVTSAMIDNRRRGAEALMASLNPVSRSLHSRKPKLSQLIENKARGPRLIATLDDLSGSHSGAGRATLSIPGRRAASVDSVPSRSPLCFALRAKVSLPSKHARLVSSREPPASGLRELFAFFPFAITIGGLFHR